MRRCSCGSRSRSAALSSSLIAFKTAALVSGEFSSKAACALMTALRAVPRRCGCAGGAFRSACYV
ncbi:MAG: hypothetical protein MZV64_17695 [Ignavibacteriales bacterium]|nr:hypothetical protein [Ignavibacteriales bacterium]